MEGIEIFLSDSDIRKEIERGAISIRPVLDIQSQLGSCSFDLRMGETYMVFRRHAIPYINPLIYKTSKEAFETRRVSFGEQFFIHPGTDLLTTTLEEIKLSSNLVGFVSARSSLTRLGLDMSPAFGRIDPGFEGRIVVRLHNFCGVPIAIVPGMRICSLAFARISGNVEREYNGKYQRVESYEPKMFLDRDLHFLQIIPKSELDKLFQERTAASTLMQMGLQKLSSMLRETHKKIITYIYTSGRSKTPKIAHLLNYNKFYLSTTMKELVKNAILERTVIRGKGGGFYYDLTDVGRALAEYLTKEASKIPVAQSGSNVSACNKKAKGVDIGVINVNIIPHRDNSANRLNDEYVVLENRGKSSENIVGWKIVNVTPLGAKLHSYAFTGKLSSRSAWQFEPGQQLYLITGKGKNRIAKRAKKANLIFYWNRDWFAWWPGDTVLLLDEEDCEITRFRIP